MQEQDTINILVSRLLSKDDELLRLRKDNELLREEQCKGNRQILEKLDNALEELKNMRRDNKVLGRQLSKALEDKAQAEEESELLSRALEELKNLRVAELFEIEKQKRQLYGCKSEKSFSLRKVPDKDLKSDKDDFDGSNPGGESCEDSSTLVTPEMNNSVPSSSTCSVAQSHRSDYSKRSIRVDNVVMHYCDEIGIPSDARKIDVHRKFVDALNTDHRSVEIIRLISELYWIETDCRIHLLSDSERVFERRQRAIPVLPQLWQVLKPIFDETQDLATNFFIKAVHYAVDEWEAICRYADNGQVEIDNNTAERMMKPICLGRKNYLFCGSE